MKGDEALPSVTNSTRRLAVCLERRPSLPSGTRSCPPIEMATIWPFVFSKARNAALEAVFNASSSKKLFCIGIAGSQCLTG
jgi:hypothetical protein